MNRLMPRCPRQSREAPSRCWSSAPWRAARGHYEMKLFYGWIVVGVGIVVSCIGMGTMQTLGVFLQPVSEATGWSRTGVSTAALMNWLCMGIGSLLWGALSDRFGTHVVILS